MGVARVEVSISGMRSSLLIFFLSILLVAVDRFIEEAVGWDTARTLTS